jgi:hypothetical protein
MRETSHGRKIRVDAERCRDDVAIVFNIGETDMDFIEQLFGLSPDGGDGTFELSLMVAAILIAALVFARWRRSYHHIDR